MRTFRFIEFKIETKNQVGIPFLKNDFEKIKITPAFGNQNKIAGLLPTSKRNIDFELKRNKNALFTKITISKHISGNLIPQETEIALKPDKNTHTL